MYHADNGADSDVNFLGDSLDGQAGFPQPKHLTPVEDTLWPTDGVAALCAMPAATSSYTAREAKRFRNANNHPHRLAISVLRNALGSTNGFCTAAMSSAVVRAGRIARRAADRLNRSPAHGRIGAPAAAGRDAAEERRRARRDCGRADRARACGDGRLTRAASGGPSLFVTAKTDPLLAYPRVGRAADR